MNKEDIVLLVLKDRTMIIGLLEEETDFHYSLNIPLQANLVPTEKNDGFTILLNSWPITLNKYFLDVQLRTEKIPKELILTTYNSIEIKTDLINFYIESIANLKERYSKELYERKTPTIH